MKAADLRMLRHATIITAGVLLVAYSAAQIISGPVQQVADILNRQPVQVVTVDQ